LQKKRTEAMQLRDFQVTAQERVQAAWAAGSRYVILALPTGGGKTVVFSDTIRRANVPTCAIAHRSELVSQMSLTLARYKIRHRVIGPRSLQKACAAIHMRELDRLYYDPQSKVAVAGVDTLVNRGDELADWLPTVRLIVMDEAHHVLRENKWGRAAAMFPNALGLGVTATPVRADGYGLGRYADGIADTLIVGPTGHDLIDRGFLTDYRVLAPPSDIDYSHVPVGSSGDYSLPRLREVVHASNTIVGDTVKHYLKFAAGQLGVTFNVDVEAATEQAAAYRQKGVPAEVVSAKTPDELRFRILRRFRNGEILQLCNVDLFGEGFDLPAVSVVSMVRKTESFGLYSQQFGRALRVMVDDYEGWGEHSDDERLRRIAGSNKPRAVILDHVGNVARHGLPDVARVWSLDRREKRSRSTDPAVVPVRTCANEECFAVYERYYTACPYCGHAPAPTSRSSPAEVDGDLVELDPAALHALRGEAERVIGPVVVPYGMGGAAAGGLVKAHRARAEAQHALRGRIALWAGYQRHLGRPDTEAYRRFYFKYGTDVGTAQTLGAREANELRALIERDLMGVVEK
jgi:DNA repair protein RadD